VGNTAELLNTVAALRPGTTTSVALQRGERALEVDLKVAQRPAAKRAGR
jgi:S1-C subfamily serine protease